MEEIDCTRPQDAEHQTNNMRSENFQYPHEIVLNEKKEGVFQIKKEILDDSEDDNVDKLHDVSIQYDIDCISNGRKVESVEDFVPDNDENCIDDEQSEDDATNVLHNDIDQYLFSNLSLPSKNKSKKGIRVKCDQCKKDFSCKFSLKQHQNVHFGVKPYECKYCPKTFSYSGGLINHERTHTGEKPYGCKFCDKKFADYSSLSTHKRTHTGERPYGCEMCGKRFNNPGHLQRHERIHSGERPFKCSECDKTFGQKSSLKTHLRVHSGAKPYVCNICGSAFSHSSHVNRHKRRYHS